MFFSGAYHFLHQVTVPVVFPIAGHFLSEEKKMFTMYCSYDDGVGVCKILLNFWLFKLKGTHLDQGTKTKEDTVLH